MPDISIPYILTAHDRISIQMGLIAVMLPVTLSLALGDLLFKRHLGVCGITQQVKVLSVMPNTISGSHMVEGKKNDYQKLSSNLHKLDTQTRRI